MRLSTWAAAPQPSATSREPRPSCGGHTKYSSGSARLTPPPCLANSAHSPAQDLESKPQPFWHAHQHYRIRLDSIRLPQRLVTKDKVLRAHRLARHVTPRPDELLCA